MLAVLMKRYYLVILKGGNFDQYGVFSCKDYLDDLLPIRNAYAIYPDNAKSRILLTSVNVALEYSIILILNIIFPIEDNLISN